VSDPALDGDWARVSVVLEVDSTVGQGSTVGLGSTESAGTTGYTVAPDTVWEGEPSAGCTVP
jgi:hypothetical protein